METAPTEDNWLELVRKDTGGCRTAVTYYNEFDPFAAEWLRVVLKAPYNVCNGESE